jgi:hypothetical protein
MLRWGMSTGYSDDLRMAALATFEDGGATYDHRDAGGFIRLVGLGARVVARRGKH